MSILLEWWLMIVILTLRCENAMKTLRRNPAFVEVADLPRKIVMRVINQ
jgi:hypothetical protein